MTKPREGEDLPAARSGWGGALASLENSQFRWLYASNMAFFFAMGGQTIVRSWITFQLTDSPLALGFISFSVAVPMLLISPFGGAIADRLERRNLIAAGQATVVLSELTILSLLIAGRLQFWHLLTATALTGCVFPFIMPARQAIVANIVGKGGLTNAMALNMAGMNTTRIVGPAAAGFLIARVGTEKTYAIGVSLYLLGLLCMFGVHRSQPPPHARETSIGKNILDGFRHVRDDRLVLVLLFFGLIPMFLAMPFQTLLVVFAEEVWKVGSDGLGMLSAAAGVGGVVGSLVVAWQGQARWALACFCCSSR
jgi:predicted MFS family arabinose efflux permease